MDILNLKSNPEKLEKSYWIDDIPEMGDIAMKVKPFSSKAVQRRRAALERAVSRKGRGRDGSILPENNLGITRVLLAEIVVESWRNVTIGGDEIPYTAENANLYLTDPGYLAFQNGAAWAAGAAERIATAPDVAGIDGEALEDLSGN